ncbi:MAG: peptidoglycan DD-metalloendopeptidase family protein [Anaerolineae bacterium]|nr:peptidoglycan DD-metalloendopeptidase family protein [Anaerolineae bacterium]
MTADISHAFVLPDDHFETWLAALRPYLRQFPRVAVVRSPRGNDLNRYRTVSAVAAPLTWFQDDPVAHIRRIYPQVVRIDVIHARTPAQMTPLLQERIQTNDRYGERQLQPPHLYSRFVVEYPTDQRPLRVVRRFNDAPGTPANCEGLDILTAPGAKVIAGAAGTVLQVQSGAGRPDVLPGMFVQVLTLFNQTRYLVTYARLRRLSVSAGQTVTAGQVLGEAAGDSLRLVVQNQSGGGLSGFRLPGLVNPTDLLYVQNMRVRPTDSGLRVRTLAGTTGQVIGQVQPWDALEVLEMPGRALGKIGVEGEWLKIKTPEGREGFVAAWFVEAIVRGDAFAGVNPVGVNLDALHPLGTPPAARLGQLGWVRIGYNVSAGTGSQDVQAAYNRYAPLAERYTRAGYRVMFVTSHQTYGEGQAEFWPWNAMSDDKWRGLIERFSEMLGRIARQYAGQGLVHAWQIWNEQDAGPDAIASVPVPPHQYGEMLARSIRAIRASDREAFIISGGHISGPEPSEAYARATLRAMPAGVRPDGLAVHPYGRGPQPGLPYAPFGHVDDALQALMRVLPGRPLWVTEWGVLDRGSDPAGNIAGYALPFIQYLKTRYSDRIAAIIWYAWAEGMHNGYGLVDGQSRPRPPLTERFLQA